jgi:hypothetical protein
MKITKCDICKKTIASDAEIIHMGYRSVDSYDSFEICAVCSKPIVKILQDKKLIKNVTKKDGRKK